MKIGDFINILLIIVLTGFAVGITYVQLLDMNNPWFILYLFWFVLAVMLGDKLKDDY